MSPTDRFRLRLSRAFVVWIALAVGIGLLAAFVDGGEWASLFQHPDRPPVPPSTITGGHLLRLFLAITAVAVVLLPFLIERLSRAGRSDEQSQRPEAKVVFWLVAGAALVGLILRSMRLSESLWYDEIASYLDYAQHGPGAIVGNFFDPSNHIAHTLLVWCSTNMLAEGTSIEAALRLPALIFSLLSIATIAMLGGVVRGGRGAVVGAVLAAVLAVNVLEGTDARGYSMMIALSALMSWLFLRALRDQRGWLWCAYAFVCALGIWAHFVTAFVPIGHAAWLGWLTVRARTRGESIRASLAGWCALGLGAILTLTLYAPVLPDFLDLVGRKATFSMADGNPHDIFGPEGWHAILQLGGSWYWWAALPGLLLVVWGVAVASRERVLREVFAVTMLGLPLMILTVLVAGTWVYARFTLFALPGAMVLIAIAVDDLWSRKRAVAIIAGALVAILSITDLAVRPARQPLRDAVEYVAARQEFPQPIVAVGLLQGVIQIYNPSIVFTTHREDNLAAIIDTASPRFIVIYYPHLLTDQNHESLERANYHKVKMFPGWIDWGRGDVDVWEQRTDN